MFVVHMIGNAHIDPVWLWRWQAGVDEALATLAAAADRSDEYPEFVFTRGEAWVFAQAERLRPALFARIRRLVAEGRWNLVGGTWVQPDLNMPSWESLHRQIRHGQAWFLDRFGVTPTIGYNVDSFGQPAFLPDLLCANGYTAYVFGRPLPRELPLSSAAFRWQGAGGAILPAFRVIPGYGFSRPDLHEHIEAAIAAADPGLGHTMCFYGVGDHGGGPTRAQIEWILANRHALPGIELRLSTPAAFFDAIAAQHDRLPIVTGEMQHCFIGCYSIMGGIKRGQRQAEHRLEQASKAISAFAAPAEQAELDARISSAWPDILFTAFHDILGGTATLSAWADCHAMQGRGRLAAEEVLLDVTRHLAATTSPSPHQRIIVVNTADTPFAGLVDCETWLDHELWGVRHLAHPDGTPIPFQTAQPEAMFRVPRLVFPLEIAARSTAAVHIRPGPGLASQPPAGHLEVSPTRLANDRLDLTLASTGIARLTLDGAALIASPGITLVLRRDPTDTWGNGINRFDGPELARLGGGAWSVEEEGPLRASVRMEHRIGTSRLRWTLILARGEPFITMRLEVNFDEKHTLLQLAVPLAVPPEHRTDAVPGGSIVRIPGPQEYPFQGWTRTSLAATEIAIVTQNAYSLSGDGADWRITLLRSSRMAWPGQNAPVYHGRDQFTDQGLHDMTLELCADGALPDALLDARAMRLTQPLITFDTTEGITRPLA